MDTFICSVSIFFFVINATWMSAVNLFSARNIQDGLMWLSLSVFFGFATAMMIYRAWLSAKRSCSEKTNNLNFEQNQNQTTNYHVSQRSLPVQTERMSIDGIGHLLDAVRDELSVGLLGAQGTGKTSVIQYIVDSRLLGEEIIAFDIHSYPGLYPPEVKVFGMHRNYREISEGFEWVLSEVQRRYEIFPRVDYPMTIITDEWTTLADYCKNLKPFIKTALTEFRKVNIRLVFGTHSKRAEIMGLKGKYDLAEGIAFVKLMNRNGNRFGVLSYGVDTAEDNGEMLMLPTIPHDRAKLERYDDRNTVNRNTVNPVTQTVNTDFTGVTDTRKHDLRGYGATGATGFTVSRPALPSVEDSILEMRRSGMSVSEIAIRMFKNDGGNQIKRVKRITGEI